MSTIGPLAVGPVPRTRWRTAAVVVGALAGVTLLIALLERGGIDDASAVYLLAVVGVAVLAGTRPAILAAVAAFFLFDFLFVEPRFTLTVDDPREWLDLILLLVVGLVVGRLAGQERDRAEQAIDREREVRALFGISFAVAEAADARAAAPGLAATILQLGSVDRAWIVVSDQVIADTDPSTVPPRPSVHWVLRRRPGDQPAEWTRVHAPNPGTGMASPAAPSAPSGAPRPEAGHVPAAAFKIAIASGEHVHGALWAGRRQAGGIPGAGDTRILAAAADQLAGALERDRLRMDATAAEVARRSDVLKSALLDSVSHDLRTPLAAIRAAAGSLMDRDVELPAERRREIAASIDREAEWLNRLVTNLLDMSRIEAGELRPSLGAFAVPELIAEAMVRTGIAADGRPVTVELPADLPPVLVDEVFVSQVLVNAIDNARKYGGPDAPIRVSGAVADGDRVRVTIEDGGPGVPDAVLPRLFEKFYRVPRKGEGSRRGTGIGLAVVRGLVDAMHGEVTARSSGLGGLAVDIEVPIATPEALAALT